MLWLLATLVVTAQRPDLNDILIIPTPRSFAGITLGRSDYLAAENLWGKAKPLGGTHAGGSREVNLPGGIHVAYQSSKQSPYGPISANQYLIDEMSIDAWKGTLPLTLLKVKGSLKVISQLKHGESMASCEAKLRKAKVGFKLVNAEEYDKGVTLILSFGNGLDSITYAK